MKSNSKERLYWLTNHFTYYHDYLFQHLDTEGDFQLEVCYRHMVLDSHPWKEIGNSSYHFRLLTKLTFGLDISIIKKALFSKEYFVIAGWDNLMYIVVIFIQTLRNRPFGIFSDTPRYLPASFKQRLKNGFLYFVFRKSSKARLLVTGEIGVRRAIEIFGTNSSKVINFPFATNNEVFSPFQNASLKIQNQVITFLSVGRIDFDHKGQDIALRAFSRVLKGGNSHFKYLIAGVGDDIDRMNKLIQELGLENHVENLGWVEISDLPRLYNDSHFVLHSSHYDPFPNTILESMSCGVPVIGSDAAGSVIERVISGINGYVFPDNDVSELASILNNIFKLTDAHFIELKESSRKTALQWTAGYNVNVIKNLFKKE